MQADDRAALRADCGSCVGLCCVAPTFRRSADFAVDKPAGRPCPNLLVDSRCGIHTELRTRGFPGCVVFDCFGAGQQVTQVTFAGADWRTDPGTARAMFGAFGVMRELHESLWYLAEAQTLVGPGPLRDEADRLIGQTHRLTGSDPDTLAGVDLAGLARRVGDLLGRVSGHLRGPVPTRQQHRGADLVGKSFAGADLVQADLRGAYLIGADLSGADLSRADLLGADLRGAELAGTRLGTALFMTQSQLESGHGDGATTFPVALTRPRHWSR
ncbi:MAG: pentapeptide repeat-containing protein [Nakamurella sp.]